MCMARACMVVWQVQLGPSQGPDKTKEANGIVLASPDEILSETLLKEEVQFAQLRSQAVSS